jgi:hypothetical protein
MFIAFDKDMSDEFFKNIYEKMTDDERWDFDMDTRFMLNIKHVISWTVSSETLSFNFETAENVIRFYCENKSGWLNVIQAITDYDESYHRDESIGVVYKKVEIIAKDPSGWLGVNYSKLNSDEFERKATEKFHYVQEQLEESIK